MNKSLQDFFQRFQMFFPNNVEFRLSHRKPVHQIAILKDKIVFLTSSSKQYCYIAREVDTQILLCNNLYALVSLVSLFNRISTFIGYLMPKPFFWKNRSGTIWSIDRRIRGAHTFPKDICPKVNIITWLDFELAYYDSAIQHFNHYTTRTSQTCMHDLKHLDLNLRQTYNLSPL